jgi:hypothetical protein
LLLDGNFRQFQERRERHEQINVFGVPSLDVAQHGIAANKEVGGLAFPKQGEQLDHVAVGGKNVLAPSRVHVFVRQRTASPSVRAREHRMADDFRNPAKAGTWSKRGVHKTEFIVSHRQA